MGCTQDQQTKGEEDYNPTIPLLPLLQLICHLSLSLLPRPSNPNPKSAAAGDGGRRQATATGDGDGGRRRRRKRMKLIAAYLLAVLGGNTSPSSDDLKGILGAVGAEADDNRLELLLSEINGKDLAELIACGRQKFASVPSGGGLAVAYSAPAGVGGVAAPAAAEQKKEEKVEEKEESDDDMGFSLFD